MSRLIAAAAFAVALLAVPSAQAADPIIIKFSHVVAENTPKGKMANHFRDLVNEKMAGKVKVEVFPSSQLFDDDKVIDAMLLGDVQMAAPSLSKFDKYTQKLQIFDLPFLFRDMAAVDRFQHGPTGLELLKSLESKGFVGLGYLHNGLKQLSANKPLQVPEDAKGLKFRIQASDVLVAQFEAVGALPVKKPFSEVFILLQTKAIDGQENTWSNMYSQKFFEVQSDITETNHGLLDYMLITSKEFWDGLKPDIRTQLDAIIKESLAYGNKIAEEVNQEQKKLILDFRALEIGRSERCGSGQVGRGDEAGVEEVRGRDRQEQHRCGGSVELRQLRLCRA